MPYISYIGGFSTIYIMLIREAMTSNIKTIDPKETMQETAKKIKKKKIKAFIFLF